MEKLLLCFLFATLTVVTSISLETISREELKIIIICQRTFHVSFSETEEAWSYEGPKTRSQQDYLKCVMEKLGVVSE